MRIPVFATIISIFLLPVLCRAQKNSAGNSNTKQNIVVDFAQNGDLVFPFKMVKGSSIYGLSKAFGQKPEVIYQYNRLKPGQNVQLGDIVKIPLSREQIKTQPSKQSKFVVLTYVVKPGETLYHLAKRRMNMDVEVLKKMNGLSDNQLRQGGEIILGWYIFPHEEEALATTKKSNNPGPVKVVNDILNPTSVPEEGVEAAEEKTVQRRVIGFWDKSKTNMKGLFVLSNSAKPGSKMNIYFPMKNTTIDVTVLGRIPTETYRGDIEVILSPEAARRLGIIDSRFSVETQYISLP